MILRFFPFDCAQGQNDIRGMGLVLMGNGKKNGFRLRGSRRGAAYILAITTLLAGVILALAMLRATSAYFNGEDTRQKKGAAMNLAESGLDYAFWQMHYNGKGLPYSADVTLATGRFHIDATDDGNRSRSTMLITSTGTSGSYSYTIKRVTLGMLPYHYAMCENRDADDGDPIISSGSGRGIRVNGRIRFDNDATSVVTGAWATTTIYTAGTITPRYPSNPPVLYPAIDYAYYNSIATYIYLTNTTFMSLNYPGRNVVILVYGNVNAKGSCSGMCTVVATGDIHINDPLTLADSSSYAAFITDHDIIVDASATTVQAVLYTHQSSGGGDVELHGLKTVTGSAGADQVTTDRTTTLNWDSRLTLDRMRQLHLPGL